MAQGLFTLKQVNQAIRQSAWSNTPKASFVEYLVVAGGGGASSGGAGAGGLLTGIVPVAAGSSITVTVGAGGASGITNSTAGGNGVSSVFGSISTTGGAGSPFADSPANSGGSGAGAPSTSSLYYVGGQGVPGQGNYGGSATSLASPYPASGGGGAGTKGLDGIPSFAGNGGAGIASSISGTVTTYAGGGGGGLFGTGTVGLGGVGGGGNAGTSGGGAGTSGTANTGGGGGGGTGSTYAGGAGGSGVVIVSYPDVYAAATSTTGSPTVSTSGSGSIVGAGGFGNNMIVYPNSNNSSFAFGTSNFTIEFWMYASSFSNTPVLYDSRPSGTQGLYPTILTDGSGNIYYYTNSANQITGSTLSINTWYHVAVTRSGSSTKMFVNGTQVGSTYTDTNTYLNQYPFIASSGYSIGSNYFTGAMTNLRVNNTTAVYTSNFTAPTAPLTNISGTVLLLSCNSNAYLTDSSSNSCLMRTAGPAQWSSLSPFTTGLGYKNRVYTYTGSGTITF
jgi:hypothetical protein